MKLQSTGKRYIYLLLIAVLLCVGCGNSPPAVENGDSGVDNILVYDDEPIGDRVCVAAATHLYSSSELDDALSPRMLEFWDTAEWVESSSNGKSELIRFNGGDEWWVSTQDVFPLYVIIRKSELTITRVDLIPNDNPEPYAGFYGDDEPEIRMAVVGYLEKGRLVAVDPDPTTAFGEGDYLYYQVITEDSEIGFVPATNVEPVGDPGL